MFKLLDLKFLFILKTMKEEEEDGCISFMNSILMLQGKFITGSDFFY